MADDGDGPYWGFDNFLDYVRGGNPTAKIAGILNDLHGYCLMSRIRARARPRLYLEKPAPCDDARYQWGFAQDYSHCHVADFFAWIPARDWEELTFLVLED